MNQLIADYFKGKSVAIAGFDVEGRAAYQLLQQIDCTVTIIDQKPDLATPKGVQARLGQNWLEGIGDFDIVLRTSGMQPSKLEQAKQVATSVGLLLEHYRGQVIGITGTKGKTTTSSLIATILEAAGQQVELVGNIGRSSWEVLAEPIDQQTVIVAELSSFQLSDVDHSPHGAVLLPLASDHLDWHDDQRHYLKSKLRLVQFQTDEDWLVSDRQTLTNVVQLVNIQHIQGVSVYDRGQLAQLQQSPDVLVTDYGRFSLSRLALKGQHNLHNLQTALSAALIWLYEHEIDIEAVWGAITDAIAAFEPLPYHLQQLPSVNGHQVINDSYASTPLATMAAITTVDGPLSLIIGGQSRGVDLGPLIELFDEQQVVQVFIIGADQQYAQQIAEQVAADSAAEPIVVSQSKMSNIVEQVAEQAAQRTTILFSPAHPSFDMFKDFNDRGQQFTNVVENMSSNHG